MSEDGPRGASGESAMKGLHVQDTVKTDGKEVQFLTDEKRLTGYIKILYHTPDAKATTEEVMGMLNDQGIRVGEVGLENISKAVVDDPERESAVGPFLVVQGKAPVDGSDGYVKWLVAKPNAEHRQKSAGRVDYRERNLIVNVRQGQKILRITQATTGQNGEDIYGNILPCQQGRSVSIRRGKNVEVTPDGQEFFAVTTGMLEVTGDTVSVDPQLFVPGDVDMTVGNINFIGPVKVNNDVRDGFSVKAGKEIEVGGMVECAILQSGSYIHIQGGVAGKGKGRITCKGNLEARYLSEVFVETGGDITISNSITNCTVKSLGKVTVNSGGIRGANVVAQKGLSTPEVGSEMGVQTILVVGIDYHVKDKLVNVEREIGVVREAVEKIENALGPLLADGSSLSSLPPDRADVARRLMAQLDMLVARGDSLAEKRNGLMARMHSEARVPIEIGKKIFMGVVIQIGTCRRTFEMDVLGPVKLYPDIENGSVIATR